MGVLDKIETRANKKWDKEATKLKFAKFNAELIDLQNLLYAENKWKILVVFQGMDASGKDGVTRNVFKGVNPLGIRVKSFKAPNDEEKSYNYLWRIFKELPRSGMIQVFNRSYYEDILVPSVHHLIDKKMIDARYDDINAFEKILINEHTILLKFYLHISKKEQSVRLKERISLPEKNWKYDASDLKESRKWNDYMEVYEKIFKKCAKHSPWHVIPADQNWYRDYLIIKTIVDQLKSLKMKYPLIKK